MATANASEGLRGSAFIKRASGWYIATAVVFIILGIFAIVEPGLAGLAVAFLVGWLLIFAGAAHLLGTFSGGGVARVIWQLIRSEEHTSELQSLTNLVCRLLLEKKKYNRGRVRPRRAVRAVDFLR